MNKGSFLPNILWEAGRAGRKEEALVGAGHWLVLVG